MYPTVTQMKKILYLNYNFWRKYSALSSILKCTQVDLEYHLSKCTFNDFSMLELSVLLFDLFTVEQDVQPVRDGESHGQSKRWTLHSHYPVQSGQHLVWVRWCSRPQGEEDFTFIQPVRVVHVQSTSTERSGSKMFALVLFNAAG